MFFFIIKKRQLLQFPKFPKTEMSKVAKLYFFWQIFFASQKFRIKKKYFCRVIE